MGTFCYLECEMLYIMLGFDPLKAVDKVNEHTLFHNLHKLCRKVWSYISLYTNIKV